MKIIAAPVEMVAKFDRNGNPKLTRFAYNGKIIDIEQVISTSEEKLAGNRMKIFVCQSEIDGEMKKYELKFELQTCIWILWKM